MSDKKKAFWFIALLSTLVIIPFLGETIFYSKGEPREAIVAYSMLESGNWISVSYTHLRLHTKMLIIVSF